MHSSFARLPSQFEWLFAGLLVWGAIIWSRTAWPLGFFVAVVFAIILNGWMSSRTADHLHYTDLMFVLDTLILATYLQLLMDLSRPREELPSLPFWIYTSVLALLYMFWDIALMSAVSDRPTRKKVLAWYVPVLLVVAVLQVITIALVHQGNQLASIAAYVAAGSWLVALAIWHCDRWSASRASSH